MTLYEELGVPPDASPEAIREAYRNVARLLHPDSQTNPLLKESAEAQMKRINHLHDILCDPERRRRYDQELAEPAERGGAIIIRTANPPEASRTSNGTLVWLAATAICAGFIVWLATRESTIPAAYPQKTSVALTKAPIAARPKENPDRRDAQIAWLWTQLNAANADRQRLMKQVATLEAGRKFQSPAETRQTTPATTAPAIIPAVPPPIAPTATFEIPLPPTLVPASFPAVSRTDASMWSGIWEYSRTGTQTNSETLLPPDFIKTTIDESRGWLRGQYRARYQVNDPKLSPEVAFHFEGKISGSSGRFNWIGAEGAKGDVRLRLISGSLEVNWQVTRLGKRLTLASGTAVLDRKN